MSLALDPRVIDAGAAPGLIPVAPVAVPAGYPSPSQDYFSSEIDLNEHLELGDRSFNPPRHRHRGGDVRWSQRPHPNRDRLRVRNVSASRHRVRVGGK